MQPTPKKSASRSQKGTTAARLAKQLVHAWRNIRRLIRESLPAVVAHVVHAAIKRNWIRLDAS
eukprot:8218065-Pyramimonas_sp.AAC.1